MLKNYIKIAWKVLRRRKLFTFISLFGISFTIMLLVIVSSEAESITAPIPPEVNLERCLYIKRVIIQGDGGCVMPPSYYFLEKNVRRLKTPEKISFYGAGTSTCYKYLNNKKLEISLKNTDGNFWSIYKFNFIEGKPYTTRDVDNADYLAVISERIKKEFFGEKESAVGKSIELENKNYRIVGVVKDVLKGRTPYADVWTPVSTMGISWDYPMYCSYEAVILAHNKAEFQSIKDEFYKSLKYADLQPYGIKNPKRVFCPLRSYDEWLESGKILGVKFTRDDIWTMYLKESWLTYSKTILIFICLFLLLPVLNLVNLNVTRIFERSSEIGIRKTFGATVYALLAQFIIENIILTLLGGILGFLLAEGSIALLNHSGFFENELIIDFKLLVLVVCLNILLGLLSGIYPAYKMAKLEPVSSLRGGEE